MTIELYAEVIRRRHKEYPNELIELDWKLGGILPKCPKCNSPMLIFSFNYRMRTRECICPNHGVVLIELKC